MKEDETRCGSKKGAIFLPFSFGGSFGDSGELWNGSPESTQGENHGTKIMVI